jgi:hypothetical protein
LFFFSCWRFYFGFFFLAWVATTNEEKKNTDKNEPTKENERVDYTATKFLVAFRQKKQRRESSEIGDVFLYFSKAVIDNERADFFFLSNLLVVALFF